jgi:hypothetical protein
MDSGAAGNASGEPQEIKQASNTEELEFVQKLEAARNLIRQLKILFGQMTKSDKKYADPTKVLSSLTDNYGKPLEIGNEQDIGEFNDIFLSRI